MNREEHLQWTKQRALEYLDAGDIRSALASLFSDLSKHEQLANHPGIVLGAVRMSVGQLSDAKSVRKFIEGFN